jgi:hypothetical protein
MRLRLPRRRDDPWLQRTVRGAAVAAIAASCAMLAAVAVTAQAASIVGGRARCEVPDVYHTQAALTDTALYVGQVVNGGSSLQAVQLLRFDALSGDVRVLRTILSSNKGEATFAVPARNADVIYAVDNRPPNSTTYSLTKTVDRGASCRCGGHGHPARPRPADRPPPETRPVPATTPAAACAAA